MNKKGIIKMKDHSFDIHRIVFITHEDEIMVMLLTHIVICILDILYILCMSFGNFFFRILIYCILGFTDF